MTTKKKNPLEYSDDHLRLLKKMGQDKSVTGKVLKMLINHCEELEKSVERAERCSDYHRNEWIEIGKKLLAASVEGLHLEEGNVEWVVNSIAELGVKIGHQCFFMYKGRSLNYAESDNGSPDILWRRIYKREFDETVTVPKMTEYSFDRGELDDEHTYTFGEGWAKWPTKENTA